MTLHEKTVGLRIKAAREAAGMTQQDVAKIIGLSRAAVAQWESDTTSPSTFKLEEVAKLFKTPPEWLAFGVKSSGARINSQGEDNPNAVRVPEVIWGAKQTEMEETGSTIFSKAYIMNDLRCISADSVIMWRVEGSDMGPAYDYGDIVIVDTKATRPSPSGVFLIWDGMGPAIRNVSVVPVNGKLTARVSAAKEEDSFHVEADKLVIIGRVRGSVKIAGR